MRQGVEQELRAMHSPYAVCDHTVCTASICPVCLTVFPDFPAVIVRPLCPNCSWWRALKACRSRVLVPVRFVGWPQSGGLSIESVE